MIKTSWKKILAITGLTLAISGLAVVPVAMADDGDESPPTSQPGERCEVFKGKVAGNLGVTVDDLETAVTDAELEMIDEAVAEGRITAEQAEEIKQRIIDNAGKCGWMMHRPHRGPGMMGIGMLDKAVEGGIITQEQADEILSVIEDIRAYCQENGCVPDGDGPLQKAVENGIITQEQADEVRAILEQVKDTFRENGFRGRGCGDCQGSVNMENGGFSQSGFGGNGMMGMGSRV